MAAPVVDEHTGISHEYRNLVAGKVHGHTKEQWEESLANEFGRLANGIGTRIPTGTNTIKFIARDQVPHGRTVTYARLVCELKPHKAETRRTRLTVGGNLLSYPFDKSTPTADLTTAKCIFNSVISTPDAKFMTIDIKDFYLNFEMPIPEYMKIAYALIPLEVILQYNLEALVFEGFIYMEINRGMYGLPQAGKLANDKLKTHLAKHGFVPSTIVQGLWRHVSKPLAFSLVVDDFGVKYKNAEDAQLLIKALQEEYQITIDWSGKQYCGLTLIWDYANRTVNLSMPMYITDMLHKFQHPPPSRAQNSPSSFARPVFGATITPPILDDTSSLLDPDGIKRVQQIVGTLLYYARAVDPTMLVALNDIAAQQSSPTTNTLKALNHLLDYSSSNPNAIIQYIKSDMVLHIDSDASYLSLPKAKSRAAGHFYLSTKPRSIGKAPLPPPINNGPVHTVCNKLRNVMGSAAEAEIGAIYLNCQEALPIRNILSELGHPQPATPLKTDNATASGFANNTMKQRKSRSMDMRFYWIRDRIQQNQFFVYWAPGPANLADYFTKHHPTSHHKSMRSTFLHEPPSSSIMRGCIDNVRLESTSPLSHDTSSVPHSTVRVRTYAEAAKAISFS